MALDRPIDPVTVGLRLAQLLVGWSVRPDRDVRNPTIDISEQLSFQGEWESEGGGVKGKKHKNVGEIFQFPGLRWQTG